MTVENSSIVELNLTGKISNGETFETTIEEKAKESGIFDEKRKYGKKTFILGEGELVSGVETALKEMKEGEQKKIQLKPEQAFGNRRQDMIAVVPLKEFHNRKLNPIPGLTLELNGAYGKVQTVSGGRVRVDFNHPLAGKEIEYEIKLEKILTEPSQQLNALLKKFLEFIPEKEIDCKISGEKAEIQINGKHEKTIAQLKEPLAKIITKHVKGIKEVKFIAEFAEKNEETPNEKTGKKTVEEKKE